LKVNDENTGSGAGSISQRHTSEDPDLYQNVTDPQHCFFIFHFCEYLIWSTIVFRILPSHLQYALLAKNIVLQCRFRETCNLRRLFGTRYWYGTLWICVLLLPVCVLHAYTAFDGCISADQRAAHQTDNFKSSNNLLTIYKHTTTT
jgi:hypothetical protein